MFWWRKILASTVRWAWHGEVGERKNENFPICIFMSNSVPCRNPKDEFWMGCGLWIHCFFSNSFIEWEIVKQFPCSSQFKKKKTGIRKRKEFLATLGSWWGWGARIKDYWEFSLSSPLRTIPKITDNRTKWYLRNQFVNYSKAPFCVQSTKSFFKAKVISDLGATLIPPQSSLFEQPWCSPVFLLWGVSLRIKEDKVAKALHAIPSLK